MKFPSFVRGWETPADRERRRKEEEQRRLREQFTQLQSRKDEEEKESFARVRFEEQRKTLNQEKLLRYAEREASRKLRGGGNIYDPAIEYGLDRPQEAVSNIGGRLIQTAEEAVFGVARLGEGRYLREEIARRGNELNRPRAVDLSPEAPDLPIKQRRVLTPEDVTSGIKSVFGDDKEREFTRQRLVDVGIPEQIAASIIFDPMNLIPGLGLTNDLDTLRFLRGLRAIKAGKKTQDATDAITILRRVDDFTMDAPGSGSANFFDNDPSLVVNPTDDAMRGLGGSPPRKRLAVDPQTGDIIPAERALVPRPLQLEQSKQIVPVPESRQFTRVQSPEEIIDERLRGLFDAPTAGWPDLPRQEAILLPGPRPTPEALDEAITRLEELPDLPEQTLTLLQKMKLSRAVADEMDSLKKLLRDAATPEEKQAIWDKAMELRGWAHQRINELDGVNPDDLWEGFMRRSFIEPEGWTDGGHLWQLGSKIPGVREVLGTINRTYVFANRKAGHILLGFYKGTDELMTDWAMKTQELKGQVFHWKVANGIEDVTGRPINDVLENWRQGEELRNQFIGHPKLTEMDKWVESYQDLRLYTLEQAKRLGFNTPEAWQEADAVLREVTEVDGIKLAGRSSYTPGSLKERVYELAQEGIGNGAKYNDDVVEVLTTKGAAIIQYALRRKMYEEIKKLGHTIGFFANKKYKESIVEKGYLYTWAKRAQRFINEGARAQPAKPIFRGAGGVSVPDRLQELVESATWISRNTPGRVRQTAMKPLREEIDNLVRTYGDDLKQARAAYREDVNRVSRIRQPAEFFPKAKKTKSGAVAVHTGPGFQLQQRLFDQETYEFLRTHLPKTLADDNLMKVLHGVDKVANLSRMVQTGPDMGYLLLHGLGAMGVDFARVAANPTRVLKPRESVFARSVFSAMQAFAFGPKAASRYWSRQIAKNPDVARDFAKYVGVFNERGKVSHEIVEAFTNAALIEHAPVLGPVLNRFGNGMANFMNSSMWETFKAYYHTAGGDERRLMELGAWTRNMAGNFSSTAVATGPVLKTFERTFLMYAPSFVKASIALVLKSTDFSSYGGRLALQGIFGTSAAAVTIFSGMVMAKAMNEQGTLDPSKLDFDKIKDDILNGLNPTHPSMFLSIRDGDNYYGVGGSLRSLVNLGAGLAKDMINGEWDGYSPIPERLDAPSWRDSGNDIVRFARSKASFFSGSAINVATGKDYLGYEFDHWYDGFLNTGEESAPFSVQAYLNAEGDMSDRFIAGAANWTGLRTFPVSKRDLYEEAAVEALGAKNFDEIKGSPVLNDAREDPENFPELAAAWQRYQDDLEKKGDELQAHREFSDTYKEETRDTALRELADTIRWNRPGGGERYKEDRKGIMQAARAVIEQDLENRGIDTAEFSDATNRDAQLADDYWNLDPTDYEDQMGDIDWDAYYEERDNILNRMTRENRRLLTDPANFYTDRKVVETEKRRIKANDDLDHWFNLPKYDGLTAEQAKQVDAILAEASAIVPQRRQISGGKLNRQGTPVYIIQQAGQYLGATNEEINAAIILRDSDTRRRLTLPDRDRWVMNHPDMVVFQGWLLDTLSDADQERWLELHRGN